MGRSTYFDQRLSGKWRDQETDESYFIDTHEAAFEITLQYLRTAVLPILYDSVKGHDFSLYHQVLHEAQYLGIDRLCKWIKEAKYIDAVKITVLVTDSDCSEAPRGANGCPRFVTTHLGYLKISMRSDMEVTTAAIPQQDDIWACPTDAHDRDKCIHRGFHKNDKSEDLAQLGGDWRKQDIVRYHITRKEVTFDHDLCVNAYPELN